MATYTNLHVNPRPATGTGWASVTGTTGVVDVTFPTNSAGPAGGNSRRVTWTTATTAVGGGFTNGTAASVLPVTAGGTYSMAAYVRSSKAQRVRPRAVWYDATPAIVGTASEGADVVLAANTWTAVEFEGMVAPTGAVSVRVQYVAVTGTSGSNWEIGDWIEGQAGTLVQGATVPQPFHGDMTDDATHTYAWTGVADASTSTLTSTTPTGTASGSWSYAGIASGKRNPKATGTGAWSYVGASTGKRNPRGVAAGSWTFSGAAVGKRTPRGIAAGTWSYAGAAAGKGPPRGVATGSLTYTGSAVGYSPGWAGGQGWVGTDPWPGPHTSPGPPAFTVSAGLSGSGALISASQSPAFARAAALSGVGTLTASQQVAAARAVGFSGAGTLTAATIHSVIRAAALSGSGTLLASLAQRYSWWTGTQWVDVLTQVWTGTAWQDVLVTVTDD